MQKLFENVGVQLLVPVGAIIAAFIGGMFSLVALFINQNLKLSEIRRQWLESYRNEISKFTAQFQLLVDALRTYVITSEVQKEKAIEQVLKEFIDNHTETFVEVSRLNNLVRMRFDLLPGRAGKRKWRDFIFALDNVYNLLNSENVFDTAIITQMFDDLRSKSEAFSFAVSRSITKGSVSYRGLKWFGVVLVAGSLYMAYRILPYHG